MFPKCQIMTYLKSMIYKFQIKNFLLLAIFGVNLIFDNPLHLMRCSCSARIMVPLFRSAQLINIDCVDYIFRL